MRDKVLDEHLNQDDLHDQWGNDRHWRCLLFLHGGGAELDYVPEILRNR